MDLSTTKDFLLNESFQQWILEPNEENRCFWVTWLANHPEKREAILEARSLLKIVHSSHHAVHADCMSEVWESISNSIEEFDLEALQKK
jgi:hypothetical protein